MAVLANCFHQHFLVRLLAAGLERSGDEQIVSKKDLTTSRYMHGQGNSKTEKAADSSGAFGRKILLITRAALIKELKILLDFIGGPQRQVEGDQQAEEERPRDRWRMAANQILRVSRERPQMIVVDELSKAKSSSRCFISG